MRRGRFSRRLSSRAQRAARWRRAIRRARSTRVRSRRRRRGPHGRILADPLSKRLGQPIVIENKPGGGAPLGADGGREVRA